MTTTLAGADIGTRNVQRADRFNSDQSDLRVNAVALSRWLYRNFKMREGVPMPVIFAAPMDAFAQFNRLWSDPSNPFSYLKQEQTIQPGQQPAQLLFPLISVDWQRMRYRPEQSYATRTNRRVYWPTVDNVAQGVTLSDLANVAQTRLPAAYTWTYQIDFWCSRPDTQATIVKQLTNSFKTASASRPQTMIPVVYPGYYGAIRERLVLISDIENMTEREPADTEMRYRTSVTIELEGYAVDQDLTITPTLWQIILGGSAVTIPPGDVANYFDFHGVETTFDLRHGPIKNPIIVERQATLPPPGPGETIVPFTG